MAAAVARAVAPPAAEVESSLATAALPEAPAPSAAARAARPAMAAVARAAGELAAVARPGPAVAVTRVAWRHPMPSRETSSTGTSTFQVTLNRYPSQIQIAACAPPLPACHAASAIDVSDVTAALDNADVQAAFAQSLMTQYEQAGAQAIQIRRTSDDHTIGEMSPCTAPACKPAPDGVRAFIAMLKDLMKQQLADPSCEAVRQP